MRGWVQLVRTDERPVGTPTDAIAKFCAQCLDGDREAIAACTSTGCALHPWRPYQHDAGASKQEPGNDR